jgi:hypothetical protein
MDKSQLNQLTSQQLDEMARELIEEIGSRSVSEKDFDRLIDIATAAYVARWREEGQKIGEVQEEISVLIFALMHEADVFSGIDIAEAGKELDWYLRECLNYC